MVGVRLVRATRVGGWSFRWVSLFVLLTIPSGIASSSLPSAAEMKVKTTSRSLNDRCEVLTIPMCKDFYERTIFPNVLDHQRQDKAGSEIRQFIPLVRYGCSPALARFLCMVSAPPCSSSQDSRVLPCRSFCDKVRNGCEPVLNRFSFPWPQKLHCAKFPRSGSCVNESFTQTITPSSPPPPVYENTTHNETAVPPTPVQPGRCQAVTVKLCRGLQYKDTITPNLFGHETQEQAERAMEQFEPLIRVNCSPYLRYFLCATLVPPCSSALLAPLPPCRSLCLESRRRCRAVFALFKLEWPDVLECSQFPVYGLCVGKEAFRELQIQAASENITRRETENVNNLAKRKTDERF